MFFCILLLLCWPNPPMHMNQNPQQLARYKTESLLHAAGWVVRFNSKTNSTAVLGDAVRKHQTDIGLADYVLFVDIKLTSITEIRRVEEGIHLKVQEDQRESCAKEKLKYLNDEPLAFVYESTSEFTHFNDYSDPKPSSRMVFNVRRLGTFLKWRRQVTPFRKRLHDLPTQLVDSLRENQIAAINSLEKLFKEAKPKALIQMATGSSKTFTVITFMYRLLKYTKSKLILFLVNIKNFGEREEKITDYLPYNGNHKFTEL